FIFGCYKFFIDNFSFFIYRSPATVLMSDDGASRDSVSSTSGGKLRSGSALPTPDTASAPPTPEPHNQDYADLIKYYNRVFVARIEDFMKRFNPSNLDSKEVIKY